MVDMATERIRLIIDTDGILRRAVHLRRLKMPDGTTVSDVVNGILREALAEEVKQIESYGDFDSPPSGDAKGRRKGK
jgi:hypothetical protein